MFLNSVILGNILNHEKCELKNSIDAYMDNKIKDFQVIMKKSVDDIINTKVNTFCNKPFDKHENVLFDKDGSKIIEEYNHYARNYNHQNPTNSDYFKLKTIPTTNNIKCFELSGNRPYSNSGGTCYLFSSFMIEKISKSGNGSDGWGYNYKYSEYDLTIDKLFTIKYFQMNMRYGDCSVTNKECFPIHKTNPEYFKKSYSELDEKKEYIEIEKLMDELKILIDNNSQKKEYYESLEKRNIELEAEVKQLQIKATEINEIKSLLKDQQEYAQIIQSLLKKINKLENKAIENE
jgi:hypothetical protein